MELGEQCSLASHYTLTTGVGNGEKVVLVMVGVIMMMMLMMMIFKALLISKDDIYCAVQNLYKTTRLRKRWRKF